MKTAEVLQIYREAIKAARDSGVTQVTLDALQTFATAVEGTASETPADVAAGDAAMEAYKAKLSSLAHSLQQAHEVSLEMLRATVATGQSALKSALLINGGAAVAMLAFIGNVWPNHSTRSVVPALASGLASFVWGVLCAAIAAGATYISQAGYGGEFGAESRKVGRAGHVLAVLGVIGAYVLFAYGLSQSRAAIGG